MHKPVFRKPVLDEDDIVVDDLFKSSETTTLVYNPHRSLSIQSQRERLPVFSLRKAILYMVEKCQVLILTGETGSGKSTQVPQYLYEANWSGGDHVIGITQPRRVAAVTLAKRVAEEQGGLVGETVGYCVRFDDYTDKEKTKIKFLTEGILVNEIMSDPLLSKYSVIMIDEAHERTLTADLCLGLMKKILRKRSDLRLIVSSATLDADRLQHFFTSINDSKKGLTCEILSIQGRSHPVQIHYSIEPVPNYVHAAADTVQKIHECEPAGHVLVFLTGQEEVDECVTRLIDYSRSLKRNKSGSMNMFVLPLYGSLPVAEQMKVFQSCSPHTRKVIVATNIAEASVTINGIVYEEEFKKLPEHSVPEIQRSDLSMFVLQLKSLGVSNIVRFDFPAPPPSRHLIHALELLYALEAIDDIGALTKIGEQMVTFPVSVMQAKALLVSGSMGCSEEMLSIVAMLQLDSVFVRPSFGREAAAARKAHYKFSTEEGDHVTLLNVFNAFISKNKSKQWCAEMFLNVKSLCKAVEIRAQLKKLLQRCNVPLVSCLDESLNSAEICARCLTVGHFANAAYLHYSGEYRTVHGEQTLHIHPSSILYTQRQPKWVIYGEVVHTSREFMKTITVIEQSWLPELAPSFYKMTTDIEATRGVLL